MVSFFILSGYSTKKGTTLKLKFSEVTDFVKEIVCIGVIDPVPVESKSGLFILARPIPSIILAIFVQNLTKSSKTSG